MPRISLNQDTSRRPTRASSRPQLLWGTSPHRVASPPTFLRRNLWQRQKVNQAGPRFQKLLRDYYLQQITFFPFSFKFLMTASFCFWKGSTSNTWTSTSTFTLPSKTISHVVPGVGLYQSAAGGEVGCEVGVGKTLDVGLGLGTGLGSGKPVFLHFLLMHTELSPRQSTSTRQGDPSYPG